MSPHERHLNSSRNEEFNSRARQAKMRIEQIKKELYPNEQGSLSPAEIENRNQIAQLEFMAQDRNRKRGVTGEIENMFNGGAKKIVNSMLTEGWENRNDTAYRVGPN